MARVPSFYFILFFFVFFCADAQTIDNSDTINTNDNNDAEHDNTADALVKFSRDLYSFLGRTSLTDAKIVDAFKQRYMNLFETSTTEQEVFRALYQVYTIRSLELALSTDHLEHYADILHLLSDATATSS